MDAPYIAVFGASRANISEIKLVIEKENVLRMPDAITAVNCCMAAYYVFNISYPMGISSVMTFFRNIFVQDKNI